MQSRADVIPVRRQCPVHRGALRALSSATRTRSMPTGAPSSRRWPRSRATCWPRSRGASWAPNGARVIGAVDPETPPSPANRNVKGNGKANGAAAPALIAGQTEEAIRAAAHDTSRAFLLIRSYRIRGHLEADLDPLGLIKREPHRELDPATYGFGETDWDRPILIFGSLGLGEAATLRQIMGPPAQDLLRQDRRRVHAHLRSRPEGVDPGAHRAHREPHRVHRRRPPRDPASASSRPRASSAISASSSSAPSASASTAANR